MTIDLSKTERQSLLDFIIGHPDRFVYDEFSQAYPELDQKIDSAVRGAIPKILKANGLAEDFECEYYDFIPAHDLLEEAERNLGRSLGDQEKQRKQEEWIKEHAKEILAYMEEQCQQKVSNNEPIVEIRKLIPPKGIL